MKSLLCGILVAFCHISAAATETSPQVTESAEMLYCGVEEPNGCPATYLSTQPGRPLSQDRLEPHKPGQTLIRLNDISDFKRLYTSLNMSEPESCWLVNQPQCRDQVKQTLTLYHSGSPLQEKIQEVTTLGLVEDGRFYYLVAPKPATSPGQAPLIVKEALFVLVPLAFFFVTKMDDYIGLWLIISAIAIMVNRLPDSRNAAAR